MSEFRRLRRFLRSPKGYLLLALLALGIAGAPSAGGPAVLAGVVAATLSAAAVEVVWVRLQDRVWRIPSSALLSGLIVALVLSAQAPWYVAATAAALAIAGKHLLRLHRSQVFRLHVFNPAAVGLLAVFFLFGSGQSWWGALANLPLIAVIPLLIAGMVVANRANKLPAALSFLGAYVTLFTLAAAAGQGAAVADVFRPPFVNMALFFGFLMVTDPPTSPVPFKGQAFFGLGVAAVSFATYLATHGLYFLLTGVLAANLGYAATQAVRHLSRSNLAADRRGPARSGAGNPIVTIGAAVTALSILLILAAAVAILRQDDGGVAGAPSGAGPAAAVPAALQFHDQFTGTMAQQTDPAGRGTLNIEIAASGERAVRLTITLQLAALGRGGTRVIGNQATLSDANGTQLCQGQVTRLDDSGFSVDCAAAQSGGDTAIVGRIGSKTGGQMQGDLQAGPVSQ